MKPVTQWAHCQSAGENQGGDMAGDWAIPTWLVALVVVQIDAALVVYCPAYASVLVPLQIVFVAEEFERWRAQRQERTRKKRN